MSGSERGSSCAAGRSSRERLANSARNGRWSRNDSIAVSIVGGAFSIVAWSASGSRLKASNVSAMFTNSSAWTCATGATCLDAAPSCLKNSSSSVCGSDRFVITGWRCVNSGRKRLDRTVER